MEVEGHLGIRVRYGLLLDHRVVEAVSLQTALHEGGATRIRLEGMNPTGGAYEPGKKQGKGPDVRPQIDHLVARSDHPPHLGEAPPAVRAAPGQSCSVPPV